MDTHLRGIDEKVWRELRVEAVSRGISVAKLIEAHKVEVERLRMVVAAAKQDIAGSTQRSRMHLIAMLASLDAN